MYFSPSVDIRLLRQPFLFTPSGVFGTCLLHMTSLLTKETSDLLILFLLHLLLWCPRKCSLFSFIVPLSFLAGTKSLRCGNQVSNFYLFLFQSLFLLYTLSNKLIQSPFFLLCVIIDLKWTKLCRQRYQDQVHEYVFWQL